MNWIEHRCDMSPSFFCCDLIWCDDVRIRAKNHNSKPKAHTWISRRAKRLIGLDYKNAKCPSERNSNQNRRVKNNSKQMAIERQRNEQRIDGSVLIWKLFFLLLRLISVWTHQENAAVALPLTHSLFLPIGFFRCCSFLQFFSLVSSCFSIFYFRFGVGRVQCTVHTQKTIAFEWSKANNIENHGPPNAKLGAEKKSSNFIWCETHQIHKELTHNGQTADWRLTYSKESLVVAAHHFSFTIRLVPNFP